MPSCEHNNATAAKNAAESFTMEMLAEIKNFVEKFRSDRDRLAIEFDKTHAELMASTTAVEIDAAELKCNSIMGEQSASLINADRIIQQVNPAAIAPLIVGLPAEYFSTPGPADDLTAQTRIELFRWHVYFEVKVVYADFVYKAKDLSLVLDYCRRRLVAGGVLEPTQGEIDACNRILREKDASIAEARAELIREWNLRGVPDLEGYYIVL